VVVHVLHPVLSPNRRWPNSSNELPIAFTPFHFNQFEASSWLRRIFSISSSTCLLHVFLGLSRRPFSDLISKYGMSWSVPTRVFNVRSSFSNYLQNLKPPVFPLEFLEHLTEGLQNWDFCSSLWSAWWQESIRCEIQNTQFQQQVRLNKLAYFVKLWQHMLL